MAINVADNFSYKGGKPLDARVKYSTIAEMVAVPAADLYDGCMAYVTATKLNYQYDSSNDTDPTLGKWREFQAGGGGTFDYEDLENKPSINEVELDGDLSASDLGLATETDLQKKQGQIQQTSMPQASEDLEGSVYQYLGVTTPTYTHGHWYECVSDGEDPATYSWVEAPNYEEMSDSDMDDIVTPLPSVGPRYHKYSTEEQVVGEWIDRKPIYERTIYIDSLSKWTEQSSWLYAYDLSDLNIDMIIAGDFVYMSNGGPILLPNVPLAKDNTLSGAYAGIGFASKDGLMLSVGSTLKSRYTGYYATIRYTKTTD